MVVEHFHAGDQGNAASARFFSKTLFVGNVEIAAMPRRESVEPLDESLSQELERALSSPESEKSFLVLGDLRPGDTRRSLLAAQPSPGH
jgi:hypothetical protein